MKEKLQSLIQFLKFCIVGFSNVIISEGIYIILIFAGVHYLAANIIGNVISILNAYYWSNRYVFKAEEGEKRIWWKVLLKTYATYGFSMLLTAGLLIFWMEAVRLERFMGPVLQMLESVGLVGLLSGFGIVLESKVLSEILAAALNLIITIPINFLINKYWAYKK